VAEDPTEEGGLVTVEKLKRLLEVLKNTFKPHNIKFELVKTNQLIKPERANNCKEREMKEALRRGTYTDMNLFLPQ
jgi:hypothetical protein